MRAAPRRTLRLRVGALAAMAALVFGGLTGVGALGGPGVAGAAAATLPQALSGSSFDPGNIISDAVFFDSSTETAASIQSFLTQRGSSCRGSSSVPCLKDYRQDTPTRQATAYCSTYTGGAGQSAATIVAGVSRACGINPRVLLVMLQKEQGLIDSSSPSASMYRSALGFGCPDTAACDSTYYGFFNQVYAAGSQFQRYTKNSSSWSYRPGRVNNILYNPNASCGSSGVYIQNQATANLYIYTPYQPNAAALANLGGTGDGCSAYGNRNFWVYFNTWFGSSTTSAGSLLSPSFEGGSNGWEPGNGFINRVAYNDPRTAQNGSWYYAANTSVPGRSVAQNVARPLDVGAQVAGTVWLRSASGVSFSGSVTLWAPDGSVESASTRFTVTSAWQKVTVRMPVVASSHQTVRLEIYMDTVGQTLFMDNAALAYGSSPPIKNLLTAPGFEGTLGRWGARNGFVNRTIYTGAAHTGSYYGATNTDVPGRSLAQQISVSAPQTNSRYTFSIWVKSSDAARPYSARLALWALGGQAPAVSSQPFTAGADWQRVQVTTDISSSSVNQLTAEIYLDTVGATLFVDDGSVSANLLTAASFEGGAIAPWNDGNGRINQAVYKSSSTGIPAAHGASFGVTNTDDAGSSMAQQIARRTYVGDTYTARVFVRAADGSKPFTGRLALWALGGARTEVAAQPFTVGAGWTQIQVDLPIYALDHDSLKFEIYEDSARTTLFVDGALLY